MLRIWLHRLQLKGGFDPWLGNFQVPWVQPKKKKRIYRAVYMRLLFVTYIHIHTNAHTYKYMYTLRNTSYVDMLHTSHGYTQTNTHTHTYMLRKLQEGSSGNCKHGSMRCFLVKFSDIIMKI